MSSKSATAAFPEKLCVPIAHAEGCGHGSLEVLMYDGGPAPDCFVRDETRAGMQGFALVELAIVIVVLSLLIGAGLLALNSQMDAQRTNTTIQKLTLIKSALANYVARTGRLPCPAIANLPPSSVGYGVEAVRVTGVAPSCTGTTAAGDGFKGVVPWISLGLPSNDANDGWSRRITYHVSRLGIFDLLGNELGQSTTAGMRGAITLHSGAPVALGLPATGNQINACTTTAGDNRCNAQGVVILVSHGKNGLGAWQENGIRIAGPSASARELINTNDDVAYLDAQYFDSGNDQHFDDLVMALAPRDLLTGLVDSKQLKPELAVLLDGLAAINGGVLFHALNFKSGVDWYGMPNNLSAVHAALKSYVPRDPWGSPLQYSPSGVTWVYPSMAFSGTVYTVSTFGPDGAVGGGDDQLWPVSAGEMLIRINESPFK